MVVPSGVDHEALRTASLHLSMFVVVYSWSEVIASNVFLLGLESKGGRRHDIFSFIDGLIITSMYVNKDKLHVLGFNCYMRH